MAKFHLRSIGSSRGCLGLLGSVLLLVAGLVGDAAADEGRIDCHVGTYRLAGGADVDVGRGGEGKLRWRRNDGTSGELTRAAGDRWTSTLGWTGHPDGIQVDFGACGSDDIRFDGQQGARLGLETTETRFVVEDAVLAGRLVMPRGTGRVPIVVLIHGSEHDSARDDYALQRRFPADGIGAFVYDKRGTGASGGTYTQNYLLLADDAIAAKNEARRLAGARAGRVGFQGGSQAGWVIPLAAKIEPVDFAIVGYGLAVSPLEDDRESIALDLTEHGFGPNDIAKADHIADAVGAIIIDHFRGGYDQLAAVRARYAKEPWFKYVHGDITFVFLTTPEAKLREMLPRLLAGVPANHDPMAVLRNLDTPQLWIFGADDHEAPSAETVRRLRNLQAAGKPITIAVFPHAEHGIYEYERDANGDFIDTRNADGYFAMMRDFILHEGLDKRRYGASTVDLPAPSSATAESRHGARRAQPASGNAFKRDTSVP